MRFVSRIRVFHVIRPMSVRAVYGCDQVTDVIIVLNSKSALQAFASSAQVRRRAHPFFKTISSTTALLLPSTLCPIRTCLDHRPSCLIVFSWDGAGQVSLGTELSVSLGPLGRTAATDVHAGDKGVSAAFSYAHSKVPVQTRKGRGW